MQFNASQHNVEAAAEKIRLLLLDVDGILTDGRLYFSNSGEEMKTFSTIDGHGIKMLMNNGIDVGIITGRTSGAVEKRAADLGIKLLYQGRQDKRVVLDEIMKAHGLSLKQIAYAGDDFPDLPVINCVGLGFSVPTGHNDVRTAAHAITSSAAGLGAVREITDFILKCQNKYQQYLQ